VGHHPYSYGGSSSLADKRDHVWSNIAKARQRMIGKHRRFPLRRSFPNGWQDRSPRTSRASSLRGARAIATTGCGLPGRVRSPRSSTAFSLVGNIAALARALIYASLTACRRGRIPRSPYERQLGGIPVTVSLETIAQTIATARDCYPTTT
jgi:hypothetical protein